MADQPTPTLPRFANHAPQAIPQLLIARVTSNGFALSEMVRGHRTLRWIDGGRPAAAADETLSMLALVPMSHYLRWSLADLKRSFLSPAGAPLLRHGRYAAH